MSRIAVAPAKIISQKSHQVAGKCITSHRHHILGREPLGKLLITEHFFEVPKDHSKPNQGSIQIFARSAQKHENPILPPKEKPNIPWLLYLQGGPGFECRSPENYAFTQRFIDAGYRMLFMDPRGVGLSTPVSASTLASQGSVSEQVDYMKLFRADSIVRDSEAIRQALTKDLPEGERKWSTVGQSFGGFCTITYLSFYPEGLRESFLFGGLAPIVEIPDEVYRRLYVKVRERNQVYYEKFPEDVERVKSIMEYLKRDGDGSIRLPSGGALTRRRFRQLGIAFGFHGGIDSVHGLVLRAASELESVGHITRQTLSAIDSQMSFDDNLIYAMLHEPIYCQGHAAKWAAHRVQDEYPEFKLDRTDGPIQFTGEMVFPWMTEDYPELHKLKDVTDQLAETSNWPALYDKRQLARNEVPVYAASYIHDMYVDQTFAMETASMIKGCKVFTTNVMFHNAMASKMEEVVGKLFALRDDVVD